MTRETQKGTKVLQALCAEGKARKALSVVGKVRGSGPWAERGPVLQLQGGMHAHDVHLCVRLDCDLSSPGRRPNQPTAT